MPLVLGSGSFAALWFIHIATRQLSMPVSSPSQGHVRFAQRQVGMWLSALISWLYHSSVLPPIFQTLCNNKLFFVTHQGVQIILPFSKRCQEPENLPSFPLADRKEIGKVCWMSSGPSCKASRFVCLLLLLFKKIMFPKMGRTCNEPYTCKGMQRTLCELHPDARILISRQRLATLFR